MRIVAVGHVKEDQTECRIEVFDADYFGEGSGMPVELRLQLKERGYKDTGNNITGLRLTATADKAQAEAKWLGEHGMELSLGHMYK